MPNDSTPRLRYLIALTALFLSIACGGGDAPKAADGNTPAKAAIVCTAPAKLYDRGDTPATPALSAITARTKL